MLCGRCPHKNGPIIRVMPLVLFIRNVRLIPMNRVSIPFLLCVLLVVVLTPSAAFSQTVEATVVGDAADVEAIMHIRQQIENVEKTMDASTLGDVFTEDAAMLPGNTVVRGAENILAFHKRLYDRLDSYEIDFQTESIHVRGGLAVEIGSYTNTVDPKDGPPRSGSGRFLYVYERSESGEWKIHRMSW